MNLEDLQVFEQCFKNVDIAFWLCSPNVTDYYYISPGYEKIWGRTVASLQENPHSFLDAVHPDDIKHVTETATVKKPWNLDEEYRIIRPDSTLRWVRYRTYPIYNPEGKVYRTVGLAEDITQRKIADQNLIEIENGFQQLAKNAEVVFWICEPDVSKFHYISPGYEKIWGRKCSQIYENSRSFLESVHPDDLPGVLEAAVGEKACFMDEQYRIIRPDGTIRWVRDRTYPIYDSQGNIYRMAGIAEDITHSKNAEAEAFKALQREQELSQAKSDFIATTSHDIRTPLSIIQSSVDILRNYSQEVFAERKDKHFQKIDSAIVQITSLVKDVLLIAEGEAGSLQYQPLKVDIIKLSQEAIANFEQDKNLGQDNESNQIDFKILGDTTSRKVVLDPKLISHTLSNLIENALKYSPQQSKVLFELELLSDRIEFHIQDQGIGIPKEEIPEIFNSFYRASNVNQLSGTGLGLAIVKRCVELHNGEINIDSVVGKGTRFNIVIPKRI